MSSEYSVSDDVKELVNDIIKNNNWMPVIDVRYYPGTEAGDGYVSKHVAVDIIIEDRTFRLFVKYALNLPGAGDSGMDKIYANEVYFYKTVYPTYAAFLKKKAIDNGFNNVPKCYGTSPKNVIALENVRAKGYTLFNRKETMNDKHLELVLKTFAKLHAISYAFKDQERDAYDKLVQGTNEDFIAADIDNPMIKMMRTMTVDAISKLDPVADKQLIDKCDVDVLMRSLVDSRAYYDEYSIITQGDCWCNNMMFLYENEDEEAPTDVILVDWQMIRPAPPVLDISYFFYTIAGEETLNKLDYYLKVYYQELQNQIKALGSDPDTLYPFSAFENHWKKYCKYGFAMAFMILKKGDKETPTDVILVDWQMLRPTPPVLDISYFFYTIASEESLNKLDYYLNVYYQELQYEIKVLGSDPDKLYPFSAFEKHWKKYCKYGFYMAIMILKIMLLSKDEIPNREKMDVEAMQESETMNVFTKFSSEDVYIRKIKLLGHFMVKNDYL